MSSVVVQQINDLSLVGDEQRLQVSGPGQLKPKGMSASSYLGYKQKLLQFKNRFSSNGNSLDQQLSEKLSVKSRPSEEVVSLGSPMSQGHLNVRQLIRP